MLPADVLQQRPELARLDWEVYERGPYGNTVRIFEFFDRADPTNTVYEGFAYWHPQADEVRFTGYNARDRVYFEGLYAIEPDRLT